MTPGLWIRGLSAAAVVAGDEDRGRELLRAGQAADALALSVLFPGTARALAPVVAPLERVEREVFDRAADTYEDVTKPLRKAWKGLFP